MLRVSLNGAPLKLPFCDDPALGGACRLDAFVAAANALQPKGFDYDAACQPRL